MSGVLELVRTWVTTDGPPIVLTPQRLAELMEQRWPSGGEITDQHVADVCKALETLADEGVIDRITAYKTKGT